MKVFISWSGERSKVVALALASFVEDVVQGATVWTSQRILAGDEWFKTVQNELSDARFFVACLTPENFSAPWVLFEAGAMANKIALTSRCAYLIDLPTTALRDHPLNHYQAVEANNADTWKLVQSIASACEPLLPVARLRRAFDRCWSDLDRTLRELPLPGFPEFHGQWYYVMNKHSRGFMEVAFSHTDNGATIRTGKFTGTHNQLWRFHRVQDSYFTIVAAHSGKCLDVKDSSHQARAGMHQWSYLQGFNQQWTLTQSQTEGGYLLAARHSGMYLTAEGSSLVQAENEPGEAQVWMICAPVGM